MQNIATFLASFVGVIVGLVIHSYIHPYLGKKAENLATHEDINKLVDQVEAVTTAAKEIEAKIRHSGLQQHERPRQTRNRHLEGRRQGGSHTDIGEDLSSHLAVGRNL
jgi:hypothetical protein